MKKLLVIVSLIALSAAGIRFALVALDKQMACEDATRRVSAMFNGLRAGAPPVDYERAVISWRGLAGGPEEFKMSADEFDAFVAARQWKHHKGFEVTACEVEAAEKDSFGLEQPVMRVEGTIEGRPFVTRAMNAERLRFD